MTDPLNPPPFHATLHKSVKMVKGYVIDAEIGFVPKANYLALSPEEQASILADLRRLRLSDFVVHEDGAVECYNESVYMNFDLEVSEGHEEYDQREVTTLSTRFARQLRPFPYFTVRLPNPRKRSGKGALRARVEVCRRTPRLDAHDEEIFSRDPPKLAVRALIVVHVFEDAGDEDDAGVVGEGERLRHVGGEVGRARGERREIHRDVAAAIARRHAAVRGSHDHKGASKHRRAGPGLDERVGPLLAPAKPPGTLPGAGKQAELHQPMHAHSVGVR